MSAQSKNYHIVFWNAGNTYQAPAINTQKLSLTGVTSARLSWKFSPEGGTVFDNIVFNGTILSTKSQDSADVSMYLIANGDNTVSINYEAGWLNLGGLTGLTPTGSATVSLDVTATSAGQQAPSTTYSLSSLPWWAWVVIALFAAIAIYLVLKKMGVVGSVGDVGKLAKSALSGGVL